MNKILSKTSWRCGVLLAMLISLSVGGYAHEGHEGTHQLMSQMQSAINQLRSDLKNGKLGENAQKQVATLENVFMALPAKAPEKDADLWRAFCERGQGIVSSLNAAVANANIPAAEQQLQNLVHLKEDAHKKFNPGLWARIRSIFK